MPERNAPIGSETMKEALKTQQQTREDALVASTKQIYQDIKPSNYNKQLNKYLFPPYTDDSNDYA